MRTFAIALGASVVLLSASASAHFTLKTPPTPASSVDGKGNPPCGPDTGNGVVTSVTGGSQLLLSLDETVRHGGFYRVALALTSCKTDGCFPADNTVYDKNNVVLMPTSQAQSDHADFEATPKFPILADNLFPHVQAGTAESYMSMIQIPNVTCDKCTLQVIEFMAPHPSNGAAGYFYHHCADLKITADPAKPIFDPNGAGGSGSGGAGGVSAGGTAAGGAGSSSGGTGTAGNTGTAGTTSTAGTGTGTAGMPAATGGAPGSAGSSSVAGTSSTTAGASGSAAAPVTGGGAAQDSGGCGIAKRTQGGASALAALGLLFALGRRRRNR